MKNFVDEQLAAIEEEMNAAPVKDSMQRLEERFSKKPWLIRNAPNRKYVTYGGYVLQVISALFGLYGMKVLLEVVPIPIPYFEIVGAVVALTLIEVIKRKFSDSFWDSFFVMRKKGIIEEKTGVRITGVKYLAALGNIAILAFSFYLTVGGAYFVADDNSIDAKLVATADDPEAMALIEERDRIDAKIKENKNAIAEHKGNKVMYKGKLTRKWTSEKAIESLTKSNEKLEASRTEIVSSLKDQHGILTIKNQDLLEKADIRSSFSKFTLVFILAILEFLFEGGMAFRSYYDVRLYIARLLASSNKKGGVGKKYNALAN